MTKFDDLMDIITRNKNKDKNKKTIGAISASNTNEDEDIELEVAGAEPTRAPLAAFGDDDMDADLIDQLYKNPRNRVPKGEGASYWDTDY